jgi:hypothetical protein
MPAHLKSAALHGIKASPVDVEVDVLQGIPSFTVDGTQHNKLSGLRYAESYPFHTKSGPEAE